MSTTYTLETSYRIWNDCTGESIWVGPDADGLEMIEIRSLDEQGTVLVDFVLTKEVARMLMQAYRQGLTIERDHVCGAFVCPDPDDLGLVCLGCENGEITMTPVQANLVIQAMERLGKD